MKKAQKVFTVKINTTKTDMDVNDVMIFLDNAIGNSEYIKDMSYLIYEDTEMQYNFLNDPLAFGFFLSTNKEDFLKEYPHFAQEYDFCLREFNKDRTNAIINFLHDTETPELTEPYYLKPKDFKICVGKYIEKNMNSEEKAELLQALAKEGLTVEFHY